MFNGEFKERIKHLCDLISKEQDQQRFSLLIAELNQLLEEAQPTQPRNAEPAPMSSSSIPPEPPPDPEAEC